MSYCIFPEKKDICKYVKIEIIGFHEDSSWFLAELSTRFFFLKNIVVVCHETVFVIRLFSIRTTMYILIHTYQLPSKFTSRNLISFTRLQLCTSNAPSTNPSIVFTGVNRSIHLIYYATAIFHSGLMCILCGKRKSCFLHQKGKMVNKVN